MKCTMNIVIVHFVTSRPSSATLGSTEKLSRNVISYINEQSQNILVSGTRAKVCTAVLTAGRACGSIMANANLATCGRSMTL